MGNAGFDMVVAQLKVLNPELNSEGIRLRAKIADGQLILESLVEPTEDEEE